MAEKEVFRGVPGILRPFREFIERKDLAFGDQVVFYGVPGTCTPFIELLGFSIRSLGLELVYVPLLGEEKARKLENVPDAGMQLGSGPDRLDPRVIVVMGGLAMPNIPVAAEEMQAVIGRHPGAAIVGVCFMNMFEQAKWQDVISFDCMIDATIDPVTVVKKSG